MTSVSRDGSSTPEPLYHLFSATRCAICNLCAEVCTNDLIGSVAAPAIFIPQINVASRSTSSSRRAVLTRKIILLPATAQSAVELDQGEGFALLRGYQVQLRREEVRVVR